MVAVGGRGESDSQEAADDLAGPEENRCVVRMQGEARGARRREHVATE